MILSVLKSFGAHFSVHPIWGQAYVTVSTYRSLALAVKAVPEFSAPQGESLWPCVSPLRGARGRDALREGLTAALNPAATAAGSGYLDSAEAPLLIFKK